MSAEEQATEAPPKLFEVVGGGDPTPEQLAAVTVAVLSLQGGGEPEPAGPTGWQRAAIAEAVGGRPAYSAADTNRVRYLRPHPG